MPTRILLVEDEVAIRQLLDFALSSDGYRCVEAADAAEAQRLVAAAPPDLILLDWMLPGVSGVDFARRLKRDPKTSLIPIIMLTARGAENDKVKALDSGADDFITKPFSTRELLARVRAVMRRSQVPSEATVTQLGVLKLDPQTHRVTANGRTVDVSATEFRLLQFFIAHPERVFSRGQILDQVWGNALDIGERTIDVHIRRLRKVLSAHACEGYIQTVRSFGYRCSEQVSPS
jgi:two-component system phosphate regulon response regulator PhoB